jgi:hypothetical protein
MSIGQSISGHVVGSSSRRSDRGRPSRLAALRARLRSGALDRELASGIAPWRSPAHAARALQLTSSRRREAYAVGLERVLSETERPPRNTRLSGVVTPDATSVILCAPTIWEIVTTLRSPAPVSAEGMARLRALLCDGAGPLYCGGDPGQLRQVLEHISRWLPVAT